MVVVTVAMVDLATLVLTGVAAEALAATQEMVEQADALLALTVMAVLVLAVVVAADTELTKAAAVLVFWGKVQVVRNNVPMRLVTPEVVELD
jgi:cell division protein FtsW (lipid II flippase)